MRFLVALCSALLLSTWGASVFAREPLTFEERVKAQEALERVYYEHRVWPKENPAPKPPFEEMMPEVLLEAKVTDSLKKSAALGEFWQRPIQPEQLQAEVERIVRDTRDPDMLRELFAALGDDPRLIAECLARPLLADRLARSWYANDSRFHEGARRRAEAARSESSGQGFGPTFGGVLERHSLVPEAGDDRDEGPDPFCGTGRIRLSEEAFARLLQSSPAEGALPVIYEVEDAFVVRRTLRKADREVILESLSFPKRPLEAWLEESPSAVELPAEGQGIYGLPAPPLPAVACQGAWNDLALNRVPDARGGHTAVWTGTEMIVWGGMNTWSSLVVSTGGRYTPATDSWTLTSNSDGTPSARAYHTAIWTGSEMVIWGGRIALSPYEVNTGGRYNPSTDTWTATSTGANVPTGRDFHTAVWTGTEMIVWGGGGTSASWTGGRYNPSTNSWTPTSTNVSRQGAAHTAVWTGTEMIVWGGEEWDGTATNTGARYNPTSDTWTATSEGTNLPAARERHTAVWTGSVMIVWGGTNSGAPYLNTGGRYNPTTNTWATTSTGSNVPTARRDHSAVWTGSAMVVWGGEDLGYWGTQTGGRYTPSTNTWSQVGTGANVPEARTRHTAVWTGTEMVVWGGFNEAGNVALNTGARYTPAGNSWVPTSTGAYVPAKRGGHTAVWTGSEMIVWGGRDNDLNSPLGSGGRYTPSLDTWTPTSEGTSVPSARFAHTAVWTGSEMIVWGGDGGSVKTNTGGKYSPAGNTWSPVAVTGACPWARANHSAVWTGTEMIVWGGGLNSGGRYTPSSDLWAGTSTGANCPAARSGHTAVWTGTEMVVWGGYGSNYLNTGGRYLPSSDTWAATSAGENVPAAREAHTALWTGTEMIIWGGHYYYSNQSYFATGGRYNPLTDSWVATPTAGPCPTERAAHSAVWTGSEMIVWGGNNASGYFNTGARYSPADGLWTATSTDTGVPSGNSLHTAVWTGSQMIVWGGYGQGVTATGGVYSPQGMSPPTVVGAGANVCPATSVALTAGGSYPTYQWQLNGHPIPGATSSAYPATVSGSYSVKTSDSNGCEGTSAAKNVAITFCAQSEVSPTLAPFPARITKATASSSGFYIYFQKIEGATGYSLYEGTLNGWYTHAGAGGNRCNIASTDLGTGEMRAEVAPSAGDHYYLVTAHNSTAEGPSGFDGQGHEIPATQSTCSP